MDWQQIHIITHPEEAEDLENALMELGSIAITYQDGGTQDIFELAPDQEPVWQQTKLTALFTEHADLTEIIKQLSDYFPELNYYSEQLPDQQWERAWLKDFKPMQFGKNTWICPTGFDIPDPSAINILLDPGLAFGTGSHPTTALCLSWIDQHPIKDKTVIDYGCGSGVLAIAALMHGAKKVIAVDYDPQALEATQQNAERNGIDLQRLEICLPENAPTARQADIILANILMQPLLTLASTFDALLLPDGNLVMSGILAHQETQIIATYKNYFNTFVTTQQGDWLSISAKPIISLTK